MIRKSEKRCKNTLSGTVLFDGRTGRTRVQWEIFKGHSEILPRTFYYNACNIIILVGFRADYIL